MSGNIYGYVRVSSRDQNEDRQRMAFATLRIPEKNIYMDKQSSKGFERPQYRKMVRKLKKEKKHIVFYRSGTNVLL